MKKKLTVQNARNVQLDEINGGHCTHTSDWHPEMWPLAGRVELVLRAADAAVRSGELSADNSEILGMIVKDGKSIEDIAESRKVTPSAIYQRMKRMRKILLEMVERFELF